MPPDELPRWKPENFEPMLDAWTQIEKPPPDLLIIINTWLLGMLDDPYAGSQRIREFPDGWLFAIIPNTFDGTHAVTCTYRVDPTTGAVRRSHFGYVAPPFGPA